MPVKAAYTKQHDTEMVWKVNMSLAGATVKAFAKDSEGGVLTLPAAVKDAPSGTVTITTSSLAVGKYSVEVEVTVGGKVATFPDSGYVPLIVVADLG